ncbi:hypothetical protein MASR2M36_36830 [Providencia sp.]
MEEEAHQFWPRFDGIECDNGAYRHERVIPAKRRAGHSAAKRMADAGFNADNASQAVLDPKNVKAFLELHIEQGPVLEQANDDVGIVETIVGISQLEIKLTGKAGHAGTTPMDMRADALSFAPVKLSAKFLNLRKRRVIIPLQRWVCWRFCLTVLM